MAAASVKKINLGNRLAIIGIAMVVGLLASSVYFKSCSLEAQISEYEIREERLLREIDEEDARKEVLENKKKYVSTDEYKKEVAKEKLGLIDRDEILLKENN